MRTLLLLIAQGFGSGRIPVAPGTWGSVVGLLWVAALLASRSPLVYLVGALAGVVVSVWLCGWAERALGEADPGSVVLDEIVALPIAMLGPIVAIAVRSGSWPTLEAFTTLGTLWIPVSVFLCFRLFDVAKPGAIRRSQSLPGGWGVTVDDVLAGMATALVTGLLVWFF